MSLAKFDPMTAPSPLSYWSVRFRCDSPNTLGPHVAIWYIGWQEFRIPLMQDMHFKANEFDSILPIELPTHPECPPVLPTEAGFYKARYKPSQNWGVERYTPGHSYSYIDRWGDRVDLPASGADR